MVNSTVEQRVEFLENAVREIGQMCLRVGNGDTANSNPARAILPAGTPEVAGTSSNAAASGQIVALSQFLAGVQPLSPGERLQVVEAAIKMLEGVFVHLPLKRAMHGIDPLQRLRLVKLRLEEAIVHNEAESSDRSFHDEMIEIFHSLRDLHTNYILPVGYQKRIAFLPFLIQEYFDGTPAARNYIVTRIQPGFVHDTFKEQVTITHWNGIPIDRAVEVNAAREAGSNSDARHARGLEALTMRPISLTAPPDEDWVIVGYQANGMNLEIRLQWQVMMPPVSLNSANVDDPMALAGPAAHVMGFDAATEATRRARKALFDPNAMGQERQMSQIVVAASGQPTSAFDAGAGTAAPFAFGDSSTTPYLY